MRHQSVSPHNIYETMSRSRKRMPGSTWCCCKSQKKGKQASSRKFRRKAHVLLRQGKTHLLPLKSFEVMSPWDLGGDGKAFFGFHPEVSPHQCIFPRCSVQQAVSMVPLSMKRLSLTSASSISAITDLSHSLPIS